MQEKKEDVNIEFLDIDFLGTSLDKKEISKEESNNRIKDLDDLQKPIEKMLVFGKEVLSDRELLAILLGSGSKTKSCIDLAGELLAKIGSYDDLMKSSLEELSSVKGIGKVKSARIVAGLELGRRISTRGAVKRVKIDSPESVASLFMETFKYETEEHFLTLLLDTKNQIIGIIKVSRGDLNKTIVTTREVFKQAVKRSANSMILVHNHPSGDPKPSREDIMITKRIIEGGKILSIDILDHIIIGYDRYFSMKSENIID